MCGAASVTVLVTVWEYFGRKDSALQAVFPPPSRFLPDLLNSNLKLGLGAQSATVWQSILATLSRVFLGLGLGLIAAILCALPVATSAWVRRFAFPIIRLVAPVAPVAWIPLGLVLFGIGNSTAVFIVFMGVFATLTIGTVAALESVPETLLETASSMGCYGLRKWLLVIAPFCLPQIFTIIRLNFIAAWMAVLAAEMTGLGDGLGAVIMLGRNLFDNKLILLGMLLIGVTGFLIDSALGLVQKKFLWWGNK